jgi:putative ABC transport system ATP-binding protein
MELLVKLHKEGKTIIIITHTPEVDVFAKRHIFLKD